MRFILLVEGETEKFGVDQFLKRWLDCQLTEKIGIKTLGFNGWPDLFDEAPNRAGTYLTGPGHADVIAVISLLDLYGPTFYPRNVESVTDRYAWGTKHMENRVLRYFQENGIPEHLAAKYRHYFAVHETEAWFIAQPSLFKDKVEIRKDLEKRKNPERINFDSPPGKLLNELYKRHYKRAYQKTKNAKNFFPHLDVNTVAAKCPYLKQMLDELIAIAVAAGAVPVNRAEGQ